MRVLLRQGPESKQGITVSATITDVDAHLREQIDEPIPCDFRDHKSCPKEPAQWALYRNPCPDCGYGGVAFACDVCKVTRLTEGHTVICGNCRHVFADSRKAYRYVERLDRR